MFQLDRTFGWIVLCAFPFIVGCLILCMVKANPLFTRLQAELDEINAILQEDIAGIRIVKACVREVYEKLRFGKANGALIRTQLKTLVIFAFLNPVINALMYAVVAILLLVGARDVAYGSTTPGSVMAAITYTTQLLHGIMMLTMIFQNISRGLASWKRVKEILRSEPALRDGGFSGPTQTHGEIEFRDASFAYPGSSAPVLEHINLKIRPGETVAIMGATGCGKTSLVSLIPRFYDVTGGAVLVDGVDVRQYRQKALREKVASVLQKSELFSATIAENIAWGAPDASAEQIRSAAVTAQADGFISSTALGYDTPVAERGMSLSGGQKQRISISRAVLKNAEILIFDDSTSALDLKTEANLHEALRRVDPVSAGEIHENNVRRVIRALEIYECTGTPKSAQRSLDRKEDLPYEPVLAGVTWPREALYARCDARVDAMLRAGLVEEVRALRAGGLADGAQSMQAIGYKEIAAYLRGEASLEAAREQMQRNTRHLAKRQLTWFRANDKIRWFDRSACADPSSFSQELAEYSLGNSSHS